MHMKFGEEIYAAKQCLLMVQFLIHTLAATAYITTTRYFRNR